jgi:hypothetical protein
VGLACCWRRCDCCCPCCWRYVGGRVPHGEADRESDSAVALLWISSYCEWTQREVSVVAFCPCSASGSFREPSAYLLVFLQRSCSDQHCLFYVFQGPYNDVGPTFMKAEDLIKKCEFPKKSRFVFGVTVTLCGLVVGFLCIFTRSVGNFFSGYQIA